MQNIKHRKALNRLARNCNSQNKAQHFKAYLKQKTKTQILIREEISKYENNMTNEIRNDKSRKKLWTQIKKLQGKENSKKEISLHDENGKKIEDQENLKKIVGEFWKGVYQCHPNESGHVWNEAEIGTYENKMEYDASNGPILIENSQSRIPAILEEHLDAAIQIDSDNKVNTTMSKPEITMEDIERSLKKVKKDKTPGPNGVRNVLMIEIGKTNKCKEILRNNFNEILETGNVPPSWTKSKTTLIEKKRKPKAEDLRPIALINCTYKLFMSIIKDKLEEHLSLNMMSDSLQAGFSPNRQVEDNLYLLDYCINDCFKTNRQLIVTSIDFKKAFDSIKRSALIDALKEHQVHPDIIIAIFNIYKNDSTDLYMNQNLISKLNITSGIRQGCKGSTTLFKLVTYIIIKHLRKTNLGFRNSKFHIPLLFFADDGLMLSNSAQEASHLIRALHEISSKCGLQINKLK